MIKNKESLSMSESLEYLNKEKYGETISFIKQFTKMDFEKAKKLRGELEKLDLIKLNRDSITKIIEMLPKEKEELMKSLSGSNLDEEEVNKILEVIKNFK